MSEALQATVKQICKTCDNDRTRMMDIVREVQNQVGCVNDEAMDLIAKEVGCHRVEVEAVVTFYAFYSDQPKGKIVIRLCDDIIDKLKGADQIGQVLREELGIGFGETTPDGKFTLEHTPCIGMCDQAPAAMVNDTIVTEMTTDSARQMLRELKEHGDPTRLVKQFGDGNNANELVKSMVKNNIRLRGDVIFSNFVPGQSLQKALALSPVEVIRNVKTARLRGRGGAGFPTGMKWEFTRGAEGDKKVILCNADEGEPGTFKDRVILTECPDMLFEGMTIGGYAIGADEGILYLRGEYMYMRPYLEHILEQRRTKGLLGKNVGGKDGFDFDIRIQMGAGAYVCGEETALISSCEGLRGDPKNRPPFPAQKGYLGLPSSVNNVETLCAVTRIMEHGPSWFNQMGSQGSPGTKVLSISGDCISPGVYEVPFGIPLREVLRLAGAENALGVQVGGPSGQMVGKEDFDKIVCYDHLATGGSIMIFGPGSDILDVAKAFMEFFVEESCGYCTPCRAGNVLLLDLLKKVMEGRGEMEDLDTLQGLGETVKTTSRCGLGQTSANPILTTLKNFRDLYEKRIKDAPADGLRSTFDIHDALGEAEGITGRKSVHFA